MIHEICFYVKGNMVEVNAQDFLLGELTESCLNIQPDEFAKLHEKLKEALHIKSQYGTSGWLAQLVQGENAAQPQIPTREEWLRLNTIMLDIDKQLRTYRIFEVLASPDAAECLAAVPDLPDAELTVEFWRYYRNIVELYESVIDDIYSFNRTIYLFIHDYLANLKTLNPENYAAAYFDFLNSPLAYKIIVNPINSMNPDMSYTNSDSLQVSLVPMELPNGEYVIAEYYHAQRLQAFLKIDFLKGLMIGHQIRRCKHCKRFFLLTKGYHTLYCDKPSPEHPHFTCNQMAFRKTGTKEENADNPKYQIYRKCVKRIEKSCQRGSISELQRTQLLHKAEELYHTAMTTAEYTNEAFAEILDSGNLYEQCGITPPRKGRPKRT